MIKVLLQGGYLKSIDSRPAEVVLKNEIHHTEEHEEKNIDEKIKEIEDEEKKEFFKGDL